MRFIYAIINSSFWQYGFALGIITGFLPSIVSYVIKFVLKLIR